MTPLDEIAAGLDRDEDARRDAIAERRAFLRATRCRCEPGMPGHCPGPAFCPYCQDEEPTDDR